jgi:hypothetical protein
VDDEPQIGPAPRLKRGGIPIAYVAGGVLALVVAVGIVVALTWKGPSVVIVPRLDSQNKDQLHLICTNCEDGTTAALGDAKATFKATEADLSLATPLVVGDNPLSILLDRPGWGRDEEIKAVVPIAFRIRADLAGLSGAHPAILVRVQAVSGTVIRIADKPVALDAHGEAVYSLDVSTQTNGWADDVKVIDQAISYSIVPPATDGHPGAEQKGSLPVRAGVASLHLDAPGLSPVVETGTFRVAGRTVKGATVTANGQPVPVDADGNFARSYEAPSLGDLTVELRADAPQLASRTARFSVKRVAHLSDEAKNRERAPQVGYGAIVADAAGSVGKPTVVEGDVVDARVAQNQVVALVDDTRGCDDRGATPCIVRVVYAGDDQPSLSRGVHIRAYGQVTGVVAAGTAAGGQTPAIPVVQADFVLKGRGSKR